MYRRFRLPRPIAPLALMALPLWHAPINANWTPCIPQDATQRFEPRLDSHPALNRGLPQVPQVSGFVHNSGQWPEEVAYRYQRGPFCAWFLDDKVRFSILRETDDVLDVIDLVVEDNDSAKAPQPLGSELFTHHYIRSAPSGHTSHRANVFGRLRYTGIRHGIDMVWYEVPEGLEFDLIAQPGTDPSAIRLRWEGTKSLEVDTDGSLLVQFAGGTLRQHAPIAWQEHPNGQRDPRQARYVLLENQRAILEVGDLNPTLTTVVDPVLEWSTFVGGHANDLARDIAIDASTGDIILAGETWSHDFPVTPGAFSQLHNGHGIQGGFSDMFVARLAATGDRLIWSTFIGDTAPDVAYAVQISEDGNIAVGGATGRPGNFPTVNPIQPTYAGGSWDGVLLELTPDGSALRFSTLFGGSENDIIRDIAVHPSGAIAFAGETTSLDLMTTPGAPQPTFQGGTLDGFAGLLRKDKSALLYSTYLGGAKDDVVNGVAIALDGKAFFVGRTDSTDFPVTPGTLQQTWAGSRGSDAFMTSLDSSGGALVASTYFGGFGQLLPQGSTGHDEAYDVSLDANGLVTISGGSNAQSLYGVSIPITGMCFAAQFDTQLTTLRMLEVFGGSGFDYGAEAVAIDSEGFIHLTGRTETASFPVTLNAFDPLYNGSHDAFYTKIDPRLPPQQRIVYSTFLGGVNSDQGLAIACDGFDSIVVAGSASSVDFPTTPLAFSETLNLGLSPAHHDAFLCRFHSGMQLTPAAPGIAGQPNTVTITEANPGAKIFLLTSSSFGSTAIPGCGSRVLGLNRPRVLAARHASSTGSVTITSPVPGRLQGRLVVLQAAEVVSCETSNVTNQVL